MGKKKEQPAAPADATESGKLSEEKQAKLDALLKEQKKENEAAEKKEQDEEEELPPIVKELQAIDDEFQALEQELEQEQQKLMREKIEKQATLLKARAERLAKAPEGEAPSSSTGTPGHKGFWAEALMKLPHLEAMIQPHDEDVLQYIQDITFRHKDGEDLNSWFEIKFVFAENPYFTNSELVKAYTLKKEDGSKFYSVNHRDDFQIEKIDATAIQWKEGKNVTVEVSKKKTKGGGAKKAKQKAKVTEEPVPSFFRFFFQPMHQDDGEIPEAMEGFWEEDFEDLMEQDLECGYAFLDSFIPYSVRWFTGEARPFDDDDEDSESEEITSDEDEDDDDDEEDEDETPPKKGGRGKGKAKAKAKAGGKGEEECKQQ